MTDNRSFRNDFMASRTKLFDAIDALQAGDENMPISLKDIARLCDKTSVAVCQQIIRLVKEGVITKERRRAGLIIRRADSEVVVLRRRVAELEHEIELARFQ